MKHAKRRAGGKVEQLLQVLYVWWNQRPCDTLLTASAKLWDRKSRFCMKTSRCKHNTLSLAQLYWHRWNGMCCGTRYARVAQVSGCWL